MSINERWEAPKKHILELDESQMMILRAMLELAEAEYSKVCAIYQAREEDEMPESDFDRLNSVVADSHPK